MAQRQKHFRERLQAGLQPRPSYRRGETQMLTEGASAARTELEDNATQDNDLWDNEEYDESSSDDHYTPRIVPDCSSDKNWFEKSVQVFRQNQINDTEVEDVQLSDQQKASFETKRSKNDFYECLIRDETELDKLVSRDPSKYKRCLLKIESAHMAKAKVLDKGSDAREIVISGRSKCGQAYTDDEVVVELIGQSDERSGAQTEQLSGGESEGYTDNLAHGRVLGMYPSRRKRHRDVEYPVVACTLDELEDHLMKPLCKTVPKVHIMNDAIKRKHGDLAGNKVEIKQIINGWVRHKRIKKIDPAKRDLYVFKVILLTWRLQSMYPLGAVLDVSVGGKDFPTELAVLSLQHQVCKFYPKDVVQEVNHMKNRITNTRISRRRDIRNENIFTIDPSGSEDLDDAFSIKMSGDYVEVGVHIADVTSVVKKGSAIDQEARKRAVTFYPPCCKPHQMLPEPLSHATCSLLPDQDRPAISIFFQFDKSGVLRKDKEPVIQRTLIKSSKQFTYEEVQGIINDSGRHVTEKSNKDILHLHMIASKLREKRIGNRQYYVPFEDCRIQELLDSETGNVQAHALVEEFMILTNMHVANRLRSNPMYGNVLILRSQKQPTPQQLAEWQMKEGSVSNLVMNLQGKKTSREKVLSLSAVSDKSHRSGLSDDHVLVQEEVWTRLSRCLQARKWEEARTLACADALHPLQCLAGQHWIEMMDSAEYKCARGLNEPEASHFDLGVACYTHFTSPIRRYADLHVHRLLHAELDGNPPDCTPEEVTQLCSHLNSATSRAQAFEKGCYALLTAKSLEQQPLVFRAFVDKVNTEGMILYLPSFHSVSGRKQELSFSTLGIASQPEMAIDTARKQEEATVKLNAKIYNTQATCPKEFQRHRDEARIKTSEAILTIDICSQQFTVLVGQKGWAATLNQLSAKRGLSVNPLVSTLPRTGVRYITCEIPQMPDNTASKTGDGDSGDVRQCIFRMLFTPGQVLKIQMSARASKGLTSPCLELVHLTRNVTICTRHLMDPVSALTLPASRLVRDQNFTSYQEYYRAWMPLLEMEAAVEAGNSAPGIMVENVKVKFTRVESRDVSKPVFRGTFQLSTKFCFDRCIEFGGSAPIALQPDEELKGTPSSPLDYLCIRYQLECSLPTVSRAQASPFAPVLDTHYTWIGHAGVVSVKKVSSQGSQHARVSSWSQRNKEKSGQELGDFVQVTFCLNQNSPQPPGQLMTSNGDNVFLEILPKSEVTRRAQETLREIESCELAKSLAYGDGRTPRPLDERRLSLGRCESNHEVHVRGITGTILKKNNDAQTKAIQTALTNTVSIIQGPPGTGKSYTGVKLVYLFSKINRQLEEEGRGKKMILFCGPSNKAVDHVAKILLSRLGESCPKLVRIYGSSIETKDYPIPRYNARTRRGARDLKSDPELTDISLHHIIRKEGKPHAEEITRYDSFFALCLECPTKFKASRKCLEEYQLLINKATIEDLGNYEVILTTCAVGGNRKLIRGTKGKIFQVMIDECAMSPEPHSLVPIVANKAEQVVLIGDHKQLRPIITCQAAADLGLDQSLFERLFKKRSIPRVFLNTQYRMHPEICAFPSIEFYDGKLQSDPLTTRPKFVLPIWPRHPGTCEPVPHILVDVRGEEETLTVSTDEGNERSKSNRAEADKVIEVLTYLKHACEEKRLELERQRGNRENTGYSIKILTQYNAQRHVLQEKLAEACVRHRHDSVTPILTRYDLDNISISTVVSSQGDEWDYVILSTVRSLPSYKIEPRPSTGWCRQNMGFITDENQVNVALTRARRGLIIVGNAELLACDPVWNSLITRYRELGCLKTSASFPPWLAQHNRRRFNIRR